MNLDKDILQMLESVERGSHDLGDAITSYLKSLPGYHYNYHRPLTVTRYEDCLTKGKNQFLAHAKEKCCNTVEDICPETLETYKDILLNTLDPQTVRTFITAIRQFLFYCARMGWISKKIAENYHLPKLSKRKPIRTIPKNVLDDILKSEWGNNPFSVSRNHFITCLLIKRGLHPKELPLIKETDIYPYQDLCYIKVIGKRNVERDVMLDHQSFAALRDYMIERYHYMKKKKINSIYIFLSLTVHNGNYQITTSAVQAVVRMIKNKLKELGCPWDLSALNPQGCRRSAVSAEYEKAEYMPLHHPEMTLSGQYGHSLEIAQKHYWKRSKKNAYLMMKYAEEFDKLEEKKTEEDPDNRNIFPSDSFFGKFGFLNR